MDPIQKLMNIVVPPIAMLILVIILPPFLVFKFLSFIKRSFHSKNVAGKVVLITGASSGIGEHLAYEYARRRACLALTARRANRLQEVASKARSLGSPDVIVVPADVSNVKDCERFVHETVKHFGRLDHLVNNAGIAQASIFEDLIDISNTVPVMDINFWGSVYSTHFAVPHLRKSRGKIIVISSVASWLSLPTMSIYSASKAALVSFYESVRAEFGSDIGITIVSPGIIDSEMTNKNLPKSHLNFIPVASTQGCAEAIVNSACRGDRYLTEPSWVSVGFLWKLLCPEGLEWTHRFLLSIMSKKQN